MATQPDQPLRIKPGPDDTSLAISIAVALLFAAPLVVVSQIAAHLRFDVVDDQMFGYFGWRIAHGAVPYLDVWDNKPPGIYWINALGFLLSGGSSYGGVVFLCAAALVSSLAAFFSIAISQHFRGAAALATIFAAFYLSHGYYQGGTNRTETFLTAFELAAVLLYVRGCRRDRWWIWLASGTCCGCAFLFKQVGLAAWGAMGVHAIGLTVLGLTSPRTGLRRCLLLAAGMLLPVGLAAGVLAAQGALDAAWFAVVTFNRAYFEAGASSLSDTLLNRHMLVNDAWDVLKLPALTAVATLIHALLWVLRPQYRPPEIEAPLREFGPACPHFLLLLVVWLAVAWYGAVISPHHFRHYLLPTLPPLLLIAAQLVNLIKTEIGLLDRLQQRAWVVAAFVAMFYFAYDSFRENLSVVARVWNDRFPDKGQPKPASWEAIGDEVLRHARPGDRLQCWDYMPGVYLRARLLNASRFTTTEKMGQVPKGADFQKKEMRAVLSARPPELFVMSTGEYLALQEDQLKPLDEFTLWLKSWLADHYVSVGETSVDGDNVSTFRRRDLAPATAPASPGSRSE